MLRRTMNFNNGESSKIQRTFRKIVSVIQDFQEIKENLYNFLRNFKVFKNYHWLYQPEFKKKIAYFCMSVTKTK